MVRLSFKTRPQDSDWASLQAVWEEAEEIPALDAGWLFDHFYPIYVPRTDGPCFEGWVALAYLAGVVQRLRLGVMVTGNTYRHPAVLANMAATLDVVSGGRLEIGIGAGWNEEEHAAYGIPLPSPRERMDRLYEACAVLDGLLTQETTTFDGRYYQLREARCEPKPVQRPRPPLVLGGQGNRLLAITARWADEWNYSGSEPDGLAERHAVLAGHCEALGRDVAEIAVSVHVGAATPAETAARAKAFVAAGATHLILYLDAPFRQGVLGPITDAVAEALT